MLAGLEKVIGAKYTNLERRGGESGRSERDGRSQSEHREVRNGMILNHVMPSVKYRVGLARICGISLPLAS
jgi:hypothetical protein